MKKRILSLFATILLFSLLLCSCAEGLPLSELAITAGNQATLFSSRVENLLTQNSPLAANGKTEFAVDYDKAASHEVQNAVADFCKRFAAYTGADLLKNDPKTAKRRILIGKADSTAAQEILQELSAAAFYIGYAEKDLLILAQNDVMLCAALSYFCDTYLKNETSKNDPKDLFLPSNLAYTAPTLLCANGDYTILRAEASGALAVDAMSRLHDGIYEAAGIRLSIKSDFNYKGTGTEILVGYPDHPKAAPILASLPRDGYYIGVQGQTLMILATNDLMVDKAVTHFLSLFVTAENAGTDKGNKQIELPAICNYCYHGNSILLAKGGVNHAVLVYPAGASTLLRSAIQSFCNLYKQLTNTDLPAVSDRTYERQNDVFEILIGRTSQRESQMLYFEGITKGNWHIKITEDGKSLLVGANGEFALKAAVEALGSTLTSQTAALSLESIYDHWWIKENVDRLLYLFPDFAKDGAEVPDLNGAYRYKLSSAYSYTMQQDEVSASHYEQYCDLLARSGFSLLSQENTNDARKSVYQSNTRTVNVTYTDAAYSLHVQVSTRRQR